MHAGEAVEEWRVRREEADSKHSYALCHASGETSSEPLAWGKCQRSFIERAHPDAQSEWGWDELQAQKYLGAPFGVDGTSLLVYRTDQVRVGAGVWA